MSPPPPPPSSSSLSLSPRRKTSPPASFSLLLLLRRREAHFFLVSPQVMTVVMWRAKSPRCGRGRGCGCGGGRPVPPPCCVVRSSSSPPMGLPRRHLLALSLSLPIARPFCVGMRDLIARSCMKGNCLVPVHLNCFKSMRRDRDNDEMLNKPIPSLLQFSLA